MGELEYFLFGSRSIINDGIYRSREGREIGKSRTNLIIGYIEFNFETGQIITYDSQGNPDYSTFVA